MMSTAKKKGAICGKLLRHWRVTHGYTQAEVGQMLGYSSTTIREWELGRRIPSPENEAKLRGIMSPGKQATKQATSDKIER